MLPKQYTLSARISEFDDNTDIELRAPSEKCTIATVEDRFAPLFLAAPDLLAACKEAESVVNRDLYKPLLAQLRAAIAKARGQ